MTFDEIVSGVRSAASGLDVSGQAPLAVQINLTGEGGGVFYVAVKDGKISVEPYEYNDRDCAITISSDDFMKLAQGKLDPIFAFTMGRLKVDGDIGKALEFSKIIKK